MHDAQIRVAIAGAGGRMGRQLIQAALQMDGVALGAALEREGSSLVGSDAGELAGAGKAGVTVQSSLLRVGETVSMSMFMQLPWVKNRMLNYSIPPRHVESRKKPASQTSIAPADRGPRRACS